jgi:hypothetical protein
MGEPRMGDFVVLWTVRFSLALYVAALLLRLRSVMPGRIVGRTADPSDTILPFDTLPCTARGGSTRRLEKIARYVWTAAYVAFLLHLVAAFHFVHDWSHRSAFEETARRTYDALGMEVGEGVYVNYLYTLIWGIDVAWWWLNSSSYRLRPRWIEWSIQAFLGFIVFNSTVVFGHGPIRWIGCMACLMIAVVLAIRRRR